MAETGDAPARPTVGAPRRPWVELRIHGVSGTPPESMLESAHVRQVAGDAWGRFFRPVNGVGEELQTVEGRTLDAGEVTRLNREIRDILATDDVKRAFQTQGMDPAASTPEEFRSLVEKDAVRWANLVKTQNTTAE